VPHSRLGAHGSHKGRDAWFLFRPEFGPEFGCTNYVKSVSIATFWCKKYYGCDFSVFILYQDASKGLPPPGNRPPPGTRPDLSLISDADTDDSDAMCFMTEIRVVNPDELVVDYDATLGHGTYGEVFTAKFTAGQVSLIHLF